MEYVNKLLEKHDLVLIQEHWLLSCQFSKYEHNLAPVSGCFHGISAMSDTELIKGRPFGGCALLWKKGFPCQVKPIPLDSSRVCAAVVTLEDIELLLFNVYMPCDTTNDTANVDVYSGILEEIAQCCIQHNCDNIIIAGDLNTDLSRTNSLHTQALYRYVTNEGLLCCAELSLCDIEYTHMSKANGSKSHIDHFLVSENLAMLITDYGVAHEGDNMSDHSPVSLVLNIPVTYGETIGSQGFSSSKCEWDKATLIDIGNYKCSLDHKLASVIVPENALACTDPFCNEHQADIQRFHDAIVSACIQAGKQSIPNKKTSRSGRRPKVAGWSQHVEEHRQRAIFWHKLWKSNNSPREGLLADIRRSTRAKYHHALRMLKRNKDLHKANSMANAFLESNKHNFWQGVRKAKGNPQAYPNTVDNVQTTSEIGELFAGKYKHLYNSVSYRDDDMTELREFITDEIVKQCCHGDCDHHHSVSTVDVSNAVLHLKSGKHDGMSELFSDHILHSTEKFHSYAALLFSCMIQHGCSPCGFLTSTIIPITKNKRKSKSDSDNYRGIALSSCLGKLLDWVIILNSQDVLSTSGLQFGFKADHSTSMCTNVLNETIHYYNSSNSNVHAVLLDMSKAFDKVHYVKLFRVLLNKGMCPLLTRLLLNMYTSQLICIKWDTYVTQSFSTTNGVKQGGVLSPILFTVYIDTLLSRLESCGVGCYIGNTFMGALAYADDVVLMAPTKYAIQQMLKICSEFADDFHMSFNPLKSKHIIFSCGQDDILDTRVSLNGSAIETVSTELHLGNVVGPRTQREAIRNAVDDMYRRTNVILSLFPNAFSFIKYQLFKVYALSLYGCSLWDFSEKSMDMCNVAWRKCMRRIWGLHQRTHNNLLHIIASDLPIEVQLHKRCLHFLHSVINSSNYRVNLCGRIALHGSGSSACNSLNTICNNYNVCKYNMETLPWGHYSSIFAKSVADSDCDLDVNVTAGSIADLVYLRDSRSAPGFTAEDFETMLNFMCTS